MDFWHIIVDGAILLLLLIWFVMDRCNAYFLPEDHDDDGL